MQIYPIIPQPLGLLDNPTWAGATLTNAAVISSNSVIFQPNANSTTFLQIKNAAGTQVVGIDTTNKRMMIGTGVANNKFQVAGLINFDDTLLNIGLGTNTLSSITTGNDNTIIGKDAGKSITEGHANIFIGSLAGKDTTTGNNNFAIGPSALTRNMGGIRNFAFGIRTLQSSVTANDNTGIGSYSLYRLTSGGNNTGIGQDALMHLGTADRNLALGYGAGKSAVGNNAFDNIFIGYQAGVNIRTGANKNTIIGTYSGETLSTGANNIFLGYKSGYNQTTNSNLFIIDNQDRGSIAAEITDCLIYGIFSGTPASQSLRFNVGTTTWHNATHTDADGGRASIFDFKGQQSGGEETTLARIEVGHDGTGDDQKGYLDIFVNSGSDGDSPTKQIRIKSDGGIFMYNLKSGTTQGGAGAAANELWVDTDDENTIKLGI